MNTIKNSPSSPAGRRLCRQRRRPENRSGQSTVTATFKQMNVPVDAKFKKFSAAIDYDAAKPDAAKATVEVKPPAWTWAIPNTTRKCQERMVQRRPVPESHLRLVLDQASRRRQADRDRQADHQGQDRRRPSR
jgi:hypothetical protein